MPYLLSLELSSDHSVTVLMGGRLLARVKIEANLPTIIVKTPGCRKKLQEHPPHPALLSNFSLPARRMSLRA